MSRRPPSSLWLLTRARIMLFLREPGTLFWVFVFPALLAAGLGLAFRNAPEEPARVAVEAGTEAADRVPEWVEDSDRIDLAVLTREAIERKLRKGAVDVEVRVEPGSDPPVLTYHYDDVRPDARRGRRITDDVLQRALGRKDVAEIREETETKPGGRYIDFLIPGLIGLNLMGGSLWGIGYAITEARRRRLLRAFVVTPMRRWEYLAAYMLGRMVFMVLEVTLLVVIAAWLFEVSLVGSVVWLALACAMGALCFAGIALLAASRTASSEVAQGLINVVSLPMWLLSGVFFSYERFPEALHPALELLPLTALNNALRAIYTEGAGLADILPQMAVLGVWGAISFAIALRIFRWQ